MTKNLYELLKDKEGFPFLKARILSDKNIDRQIRICEGRCQMHSEFVEFLKGISVDEEKIHYLLDSVVNLRISAIDAEEAIANTDIFKQGEK